MIKSSLLKPKSTFLREELKQKYYVNNVTLPQATNPSSVKSPDSNINNNISSNNANTNNMSHMEVIMIIIKVY